MSILVRTCIEARTSVNYETGSRSSSATSLWLPQRQTIQFRLLSNRLHPPQEMKLWATRNEIMGHTKMIFLGHEVGIWSPRNSTFRGIRLVVFEKNCHKNAWVLVGQILGCRTQRPDGRKSRDIDLEKFWAPRRGIYSMILNFQGNRLVVIEKMNGYVFLLCC